MQVMDVLAQPRSAMMLPDGLPEELVLRVGRDCIGRGRPGDAHRCPVVLAAYQTLDPEQYVVTMGGQGVLGIQELSGRGEPKLYENREAGRWARLFDIDRQAVRPERFVFRRRSEERGRTMTGEQRSQQGAA